VVDAEVASGDTTPDRVDPPAPDPGLSSASSWDDLVVDYPNETLPVPPGSRIEGSSVSTAPGCLQVSMQASHRLPGGAILRYFSIEMAENGFAERSLPAAGTESAAAFERGEDTVVVRVSAGDPGCTTYTVSGTLHVR
jgi:hypothetical protein